MEYQRSNLDQPPARQIPCLLYYHCASLAQDTVQPSTQDQHDKVAKKNDRWNERWQPSAPCYPIKTAYMASFNRTLFLLLEAAQQQGLWGYAKVPKRTCLWAVYSCQPAAFERPGPWHSSEYFMCERVRQVLSHKNERQVRRLQRWHPGTQSYFFQFALHGYQLQILFGCLFGAHTHGTQGFF